MELQQLRSKETFSLPPHCLQNVSLNDPSGEGSILLYAHRLWWNRSSAERPGQRRWRCPPVPWCTPSLSGHEACSRKAAVEDVRGRYDTGWRTMWAFASPEKVRWGFGEVLARSMFVFSGLNSGPGVAVGSLLMHQCSALPLCPGTSRDVRLHTGALASHCPLPGQCVWPKVCQVPRQLSVAFSLWKELSRLPAAHKATALQCSFCAHIIFYIFIWFSLAGSICFSFKLIFTGCDVTDLYENLTPADCVGVIKGTEDIFSPMWSSLALVSQLASHLSWKYNSSLSSVLPNFLPLLLFSC